MADEVRPLEFSGCHFTSRWPFMHIGRMGRFSSVLLLTLAACGDNMVDDPVDPQDDSQIVDGTTSLSPARVVPSVCDVTTWSDDLALAGAEVSVAGGASHAVGIATPGGRSPIGLVFDPGHHRMSSYKFPIDGAFTQIVASRVGQRLVSTSAENGNVHLHLLDDDFGNPQYVAKLAGTMVAQPSFYSLEADYMMPTVGDDGLWLHRFQDSFEPIDSTHVVTTAPARSVTAAKVGASILSAWSTDDDCYMTMARSVSSRIDTHLPFACGQPRLAVDATTGRGLMVFQGPDGVHAMAINGEKFGGATMLLRAGATSPRTVFDGRRLWVSFLDDRGDIIVGFFHGSDLVTMSLGGPKPKAAAYDLVLLNDAPWVVSLDDGGVAGHLMCLDTLE